MKVIAVIPARYQATRLPGKPLIDIAGKPMIQWVYEAVRRARGIDRVLVATDDGRIAAAAEAFGAEAALTSPALASGTDRVAEVASRTDGDVYLNVQGDEPLMEPATIEAALEMVSGGEFEIASAMTPILSREELENRSVVKALADHRGRAIYFSRYPIPYSRVSPAEAAPPFACHRHLGLYVYGRETLARICRLPVSPLERAESLEQLRALENGVSLGLALVSSRSAGVDTPEDLERVRGLLA